MLHVNIKVKKMKIRVFEAWKSKTILYLYVCVCVCVCVHASAPLIANLVNKTKQTKKTLPLKRQLEPTLQSLICL